MESEAEHGSGKSPVAVLEHRQLIQL